MSNTTIEKFLLARKELRSHPSNIRVIRLVRERELHRGIEPWAIDSILSLNSITANMVDWCIIAGYITVTVKYVAPLWNELYEVFEDGYTTVAYAVTDDGVAYYDDWSS